MTEAFKPIPVRPPAEGRLAFALRRLFDLQLYTIHAFLSRQLPMLRGRVLDVGAGQAPWREFLTQADYVGLDVEDADAFGMARHQPSMHYYDGLRIPFEDHAFDHLLCVEVLEHVQDAETFVRELARVLRPGGTLVLTVPWSARLHHLPHDFRRYTRNGLVALLEPAGFAEPRIEERGNDIAVIANKLIVLLFRLLRPRRAVDAAWTWPLALLVAPVTAGVLVAAHVAMRTGLGSMEDPLGYALVAHRP